MYHDLFKPSYLLQLCKQYGLTPSKNYGQNYLIQKWPIGKIIEAAELKKTDTVIEIGPGFGVLTFALAEKAGKVVAFEIERKLEGYWEEQLEDLKIKRLKDFGDINIIWGNALTSLKSYVSSLMSGYKVVANIPYQITSDLLRTLLELENKPESITLMVQKEVAQRICSRPGDMSLLAVSVQYYGEPSIVSLVSKGNFWPSPKVDSAILNIKIRKLGNLPAQVGQKAKKQDNENFDKLFFKIVKMGFSHKRKQLWGNLSKQLAAFDPSSLRSEPSWSKTGRGINSKQVKQVLSEVVGDEKVRAEELSVEQWRKIVKYFSEFK